MIVIEAVRLLKEAFAHMTILNLDPISETVSLTYGYDNRLAISSKMFCKNDVKYRSMTY
jgi:hypothetical protein